MTAEPSGDGVLTEACGICLRRAEVLRALAGRLDGVRAHVLELLTLGEDELLAAVGLDGDTVSKLAAPEALREAAVADGVAAVCRCSPRYPARLRDLDAPPAVLYVAGDLDTVLAALNDDAVAIVGARVASRYGLGVATGLGEALARAGVPVLSGMALGIDGAAHRGAVAAGVAPTVAILPGPASRPYPASHRALYARILRCGGAVSELAPGTPVRRWMFPARNRLVAALARMTVVVEATDGSGSLITARIARALGRSVGAVPGDVSRPRSRGTNALLASGVRVVRGAEDVLEGLFGAESERRHAMVRPLLPAPQQALLDALAEGEDVPSAIAASGLPSADAVAALAELELTGRVRRVAGGFAVT